jgi:hypothetical protein
MVVSTFLQSRKREHDEVTTVNMVGVAVCMSHTSSVTNMVDNRDIYAAFF